MSAWTRNPERREKKPEEVVTVADVRGPGYATSLGDCDTRKENRNMSWTSRFFKKSSTAPMNNGTAQTQNTANPNGWKPLSISAPILSGIIILTILLAVGIETLVQRSATLGGLALSPTRADIPKYAMISYLYGPNVLAVLYSLLWSWVDLDVKRMQPWFELSKPGGATAENSMFLDYQYEFVAFVPFTAAKKRHWPVFLSGTTMIFVLWFLTPLQSTLLGTSIVTKTESVNITSRFVLPPVEAQNRDINSKILTSAHAVGWLGQPFPAFTTPKFALLPYYIKNDPAPTKSNTNWTTTTTRLSTELNCWPAKITPKGDNNFEYQNGQNCSVMVDSASPYNYTMYYIGYDINAYSTYALTSPRCLRTPDSERQFLAIWSEPFLVDGGPKAGYRNTAIFCQTSYFKQKVQVSVRAESFEPIDDSLEILEGKQQLTDAEFNRTAFEFLIANGVTYDQMPDKPTRDHPFTAKFESAPKIAAMNISRQSSTMVPFALAGRNKSAADYGDPALLQQAYTEAHQRLFSVAISILVTNETKPFNSTAASSFPLTGIIVSRTFSILIESFLVVVAIFTATILWICRRAPCNLDKNPSSVGRLIDIFRNSPTVAAAFQSVDNVDDETLQRKFKGKRFELNYDQKQKRSELSILADDNNDTTSGTDIEPAIQKGYYDPIRPIALRRWSGIVFITVLIAAIVGLSYLKSQEMIRKGLARPSDNFEVLQLLENYIPTIFATLIEPFWILLNRLLCTLQPFKDLWAGKAKAANSIDATYTAIPPQLVFFRAVKSRHLTLLLVCSIALLSNLLAVGLGALFNEDQLRVAHPQLFNPVLSAEFDGKAVENLESYLSASRITSALSQEHYYVMMANLTSGTPYPPWVSSEYYFQPQSFTLLEEVQDQAADKDMLTVQTRGFGARANCTAIPETRVTFNMTREPSRSPLRDPPPPKTPMDCPNAVELAKMRFTMAIEQPVVNFTGAAAAEFVDVNTAANYGRHCGTTFAVGWARTQNANARNQTIDMSFAICRPVFETALFNVTVDRSGYVLGYKQTSETESRLDYLNSSAHTDQMIGWTNDQLVQSPLWHNDTLTRGWLQYFLLLEVKSRAFLDSKQLVPSPNDMIPAIEINYRRAFATFLSLTTHVFLPIEEVPTTTPPGTRTTTETKIFMDTPAFVISMTVLGLNLLVAILVYIRAVVFVLPRMPTTIGSILAYVAPSRVVNGDADVIPRLQTRTMSFGRYIGPDGQVHLGIEMDPHVVPIDPSSLRENKSFLEKVSWGRLRRRRKGDIMRQGTWL